jgi:hypothetical protein
MTPTFVALASQMTERSPQTVLTFLLAAIVPDVIGAIIVPEKGIWPDTRLRPAAARVRSENDRKHGRSGHAV